MAEQWQSIDTYAGREAFYKKHGVRYSELLRLPYWDVVRWTVPDPMHNGYINVLGHHNKDFMGMQIDTVDGDGSLPPPTQSTPDALETENAWRHVRWSPLEELKKLKLPVLQALATRAALRAKTDEKKPLVNALQRFVRTMFSLDVSKGR